MLGCVDFSSEGTIPQRVLPRCAASRASVEGAEKHRLPKTVAFCARPVSISVCSRLVCMKQKITTCIVYLCAATSSLCLLLHLQKSYPGVYRSTQLALIAVASALLIASVVVFRWHRISNWIGLISGLGALYWFYGVEFRYPFPALNTWVAFNLPDAAPDSYDEILIAKMKIGFAVTTLAASTISAIGLLPLRWTIRNRRIRDRRWPAVAVPVFAVFLWYVRSVTPYRIPVIVDGVPAELTLLHVEKHGNQFHETSISVFRDRRVYLAKNNRRLFEYRFPVHSGSTVLQDDTTREAAIAFAGELANAVTAPALPLRSTNAEGWYARTLGQHVLAFTTENKTAPPPELIRVFGTLESSVPGTKRWGDEKDICFGFCYDPLAGLGVLYMNDRCTERNGTQCK